jgi:hypothetical protein
LFVLFDLRFAENALNPKTGRRDWSGDFKEDIATRILVFIFSSEPSWNLLLVGQGGGLFPASALCNHEQGYLRTNWPECELPFSAIQSALKVRLFVIERRRVVGSRRAN